MCAEASNNKPAKVVNLSEYGRGFERLDQFDFHHKLEERSGDAIVLFTKMGCSSCAAWKQLLLRYQKNHLKTALFEVDLERDSALGQEFDIFHLPALYLYKAGRFHCEIQCEAKLGVLEAFIEKAAKRPPEDQP